MKLPPYRPPINKLDSIGRLVAAAAVGLAVGFTFPLWVLWVLLAAGFVMAWYMIFDIRHLQRQAEAAQAQVQASIDAFEARYGPIGGKQEP